MKDQIPKSKKYRREPLGEQNPQKYWRNISRSSYESKKNLTNMKSPIKGIQTARPRYRTGTGAPPLSNRYQSRNGSLEKEDRSYRRSSANPIVISDVDRYKDRPQRSNRSSRTGYAESQQK
jgi:hypothetical protein